VASSGDARETIGADGTRSDHGWADAIGVGHRYRITLSDLIADCGGNGADGQFEWPELNAALSAVSGTARSKNRRESLGFGARGKKDRNL